MSSMQEQLITLLASATDAGVRLYPNVAPDVVTKPYLVYQRVGGSSENILSGSSSLINTRMQIDCYATTYAGAQTLASQVDVLMSGWSVTNVSLSFQDMYESDVKLHRVILEYSIWHQ